MALNTVKVTAESLKRREKRLKRIKRYALIVVLILVSLFIVLSLVYKGGRFTVTLDPQFALKSGIILYENKEDRLSVKKLYAQNIDFMDNISIKWIPEDIDNESDGSHNGENFIAYTFYLENTSDRNINYWYELYIDDVIKNVDEAVRIMVIQDGKKVVYAKKNNLTNIAEPDTKEFYSKEQPILEERKAFEPNQVDKYTIVIWLEGDDPDCVDAIIGGEIKMHMENREEQVEQEGE